MHNKKIANHIIVTGLVQGVFYRAFTKEQADKNNITGWTRNLSDGSVEVLAVGSRDDLGSFIKSLRKGPSAARVDNLKINNIIVNENYIHFKIIASN